MHFPTRAPRPEDGERLRKFTFVRLIVAMVVVGAAVIVLQIDGGPARMGVLYGLLAAVCLGTGASHLAHRLGAPLAILAGATIALDLAVIAILAHETGGASSAFAILLVLPILAGGIFFRVAGGLTTAALAGTAYVALSALGLDVLSAPAAAPDAGAAGMAAADGTGAAGIARPLIRGSITLAVFTLAGLLSGGAAARILRGRADLADREEELRRMQGHTDHILMNLSSGLIVTDMGGEILSINPAAARILGLVPDHDARGMLVEDLLPHMPSLVRELAAAFETGVPRSRHEIEVKLADGSVVPLGISLSILRGAGGEKRGVVAIFQDLTEVHRMRERIRRADRLAAIGELSAAIAHEIRAPLASICGSIEMLAGELELSGENRNLMDLVIKESDRLDRIITDFLEFARLRKPALEPVEVERCIGEVMLLLRNSTALRSEVDMRVACKAPGVRIRADEEQIRQVFLNIMMNACEAMDEGGSLTVTIDRVITQLREGECPEECVTIAFANDGPAIPADVLPHVFEPFYSSKDGGTGLGLAIVARIVESHGGVVRVTSSPGRATVFTVTIPLSAAETPEGDEAQLEEFISF